MKKITLILLTTIALVGCVVKPAPQNMLAVEKSIIVDKNADLLYELVNLWMVETFVSSESVIEYRSPEGGRIAGKYIGQTKREKTTAGLAYKCALIVSVYDGGTNVRFAKPQLLTGGRVNLKQIELIQNDWTRISADLEKYLNDME